MILGKKACEYLEAQIKLKMKTASSLSIPGFGSATWKTTRTRKVKVLDDQKVWNDYRDVWGICQKTLTVPGQRRFLLKPDDVVKKTLTILESEDDED